jgi:peptidyl-prolyl cis-trans isomerase SurA
MNRIVFYLLALTCCMQGSLEAQTLFSYGPYKVDKQEFLWAFHKNNPHLSGNAEAQAIQSYLALFINYKLKVLAARNAKLDSAADFKRDVHAFEVELGTQTMRKLEGIGALSREALVRGQTDIEIAQVYVGITNPPDTLTPFHRINEALGELRGGASFEGIARTFGTNPALKTSGGYTGFVTVFSLPYAAENIVYNLSDGAFSGIYRSRSGYHIFKRLSGRPNPGFLKAAQILIAFSPKANPQDKADALQRADLIYDSLAKGAPFDSLVRRYSNDKMTYYNYGILPDFTTGDFDPAFETAAFALSKDGYVSKPVETSYGYHIIKRKGWLPPLKDSLDNQRWFAFQQRVFYSDRMDYGKDQFAASVLPLLKYRSLDQDTAWLFRTSDTMLRTHLGETYIKKIQERPLFSFGVKVYTSSDWYRYLLYRRTDPRSAVVDFPKEFNAFLHSSALDYFSGNLDRYDTEYHYQVKEFSEGSLLFAIMQQQIWNRATSDTADLRKWFVSHRDKFYLHSSADVIAFSYSDTALGNAFRRRLAQDPSQWRIWLNSFQGVNADSARFELNALSLDSSRVQNGLITDPGFQPDNNWHFYYVIRTYPSSPASDYEEVKGLVLGDYQAYLEKQWLASLRKKYPVTINQAVLQQILR